MTTEVYQEALDASTVHRDCIVTPITSGLINQTFKVIIRTNGYKFLLQQINSDIFSNPEKLQANYEKIWSYIYHDSPFHNIPNPFIVPKPLKFLDATKLFCDSHERYWRIFDFIDGAQTFHTATNSIQARTVAQVFGSITSGFEFFDLNGLYSTIPGFHDLSLRFRQFKQSLHTKNYDRLLKSAPLIRELKARERYANFFDVITESAEFPKRVMHHDAKISNILFDEDSGKVICPVDFDTVMPGYFFSDLGDMIRSMAGSHDENSTEYDAIHIRSDFYKSIFDGYIGVMNKFLTTAEKKYIHFSGIIMIFMQSLRFLTDYLNGDIYYKINYPEQNFDRAMNQLTLLQRLEEFLKINYSFTV